VDEYKCGKELQNMDQPKKHGRENFQKSQSTYRCYTLAKEIRTLEP